MIICRGKREKKIRGGVGMLSVEIKKNLGNLSVIA